MQGQEHTKIIVSLITSKFIEGGREAAMTFRIIGKATGHSILTLLFFELILP
jgi:hypothetical protein